MAAATTVKEDSFWTRPWNQRSTPEKVGIVLGSLIVYQKIVKPAIGDLLKPPLQSYLKPPGVTQGVHNDPRPLIDAIATETIGWNYSYEPELINQLTDLTPEELKIAYEYWQQKYRGQSGGSLTAALKGEYATAYPGGTSYFQPAIDWLQQNGLNAPKRRGDRIVRHRTNSILKKRGY